MLWRVIFVLICISINFQNSQVLAKEVLKGPITADVIQVIDGDTIDVRAQIWLGQMIETRVRLVGIDTPELRGKCPAERQHAKQAKLSVERWLADKAIVLKNIQFGKYAGRIVADVESVKGGNISQFLIAKGLARPYEGKKRKGWCQ